ncbi:MAG: flagellar filament outer layer protein FlaA [Leptospirales bacterium]
MNLPNRLLTFLCFVPCVFSIALAQGGAIWRGMAIDKQLDVIVIDDFEERVAWKIPYKKAIEDHTRFVERSPIEKGYREEGANRILFASDFEYASKMANLHARLPLAKSRFALELLTYFSKPGKQFTVIEVPEEIHTYVRGRPVAFSIWIFGNDKRHTLYAILENDRGQTFEIEISDLNFKGWLRIEKQVPDYVLKKIKKRSGEYKFRFKGLKLQSHKNEAVGFYSLVVDFIGVLIELEPHRYPGYKMEDKWN